MRRKFLKVFLGAVVLASMSTAPNAFATHTAGKTPIPPHERNPRNQFIITSAKATCLVNGSVFIGPLPGNGVGLTQPAHNHYTFIQTTLNCVGVDALVSGLYLVNARGGTDGPCHDNNGVPLLLPCRNNVFHGENNLLGWSHSSGYPGTPIDGSAVCNKRANLNANKGVILATRRDNGKRLVGWVKFKREGLIVKAWGAFRWVGNLRVKKDECFTAQLEFIPDPPGLDRKVHSARLVGTAQIGNQWVDDPKNRTKR